MMDETITPMLNVLSNDDATVYVSDDASRSPVASTTSPPAEAANESIHPVSDVPVTTSVAKGKGKGSLPPPPKAKKSKSDKRARDEPIDTVEADRQAVFRHSQRLLRKSAPSVNIQEALQRSFSSSHASPLSIINSDSQKAMPGTPETPTSSSARFTENFLSIVEGQRHHRIQAVVARQNFASTIATREFSRGTQPPQEEDELVIDDGGAASTPSVGQVPLRRTASAGISTTMLKSLGGNNGKLAGSPTLVSAIGSWDDSRSTPPVPQSPLVSIDNGINDAAADVLMESENEIAALRRKHELQRFKRQQTHQNQTQVDKVPESTVVGQAPNLRTATPAASAALANRLLGGTLLHQRSFVNTFHVSSSDVTFLKRTNSFENSQSQSIVFRKDNSSDAAGRH